MWPAEHLKAACVVRPLPAWLYANVCCSLANRFRARWGLYWRQQWTRRPFWSLVEAAQVPSLRIGSTTCENAIQSHWLLETLLQLRCLHGWSSLPSQGTPVTSSGNSYWFPWLRATSHKRQYSMIAYIGNQFWQKKQQYETLQWLPGSWSQALGQHCMFWLVTLPYDWNNNHTARYQVCPQFFLRQISSQACRQ